MALLQSTLADLLEIALDPLGATSGDITSTDPPTRIAQAFGAYFKTASPPPIPSAVDGQAVPAMASAMVFPVPGTPSSGAALFAAGHTAFWSAMAAAPSAFFVGATIITPPPGLSSMASAVEGAFALNNLPAIKLPQAATNLAAVIHPTAGLGGSFTVPPTTTPIL